MTGPPSARREDDRRCIGRQRDELQCLVVELDRLGLFQAGAHVAMAIDSLERHLSEIEDPQRSRA